MADTRCADADLQLDVDVMILEYTLYHAIKAQFDFLSSGRQDATRASESTRLLTIFDCFVHHFNQHHPTHPKSSDFYSNLDVLEFLVLLSNRSGDTSTAAFSDDTPEKLRSISAENLASRRRWLAARERYARERLRGQPAATSSDKLALQDLEDQIYKSWNQHYAFGAHQQRRTISPSLFDLLPRFIEISAEMSATLNLPPNETWMHIACEFMLQASLEALRMRSLQSQSLSQSFSQAAVNDMTPRLDDCFAWGYADPRYLVPDGASPDKKMQLVNDLFIDPDCVTEEEEDDDDADSGDPDLLGDHDLDEDPEWTQTRSQWLCEFSMAVDASAQSQSCRLDRLSVKFPLGAFQDKLISFMQSVWDLLCGDLNRKPVLAQIEEGHIKSLGVVEGPEFDEFLDRVGLKRDSRGILTFDVPELTRPSDRLDLAPLDPPDGLHIRGNAWSRDKTDKVNSKKRTRT
ncbi:hypothetical protein PV08_07733 [Exophiala spinifera]|uniref:Uncharacterized protein n=1 Tax=Exophiala spinifera TaxID=91928 RepID=A0A0D1YJ33_9EURO|nr:uncharacterized protein PV08_07733 [Exophiala spinifera]KIW14946.1 hypothetical protein PV08_07733 [Exophiala spinifera]